MQPILTIDVEAISQNWHRLNTLSHGKAAAVVKANGYGLGIEVVAKTLFSAGAQEFFVATVDEANELAEILPNTKIFELSGFSSFIKTAPNIIPVVNSLPQYQAVQTHNSSKDYALQFDTGMTRLGIDMHDLHKLKNAEPILVMSHLACGDDPTHRMNQICLNNFTIIKSAFPNTPASLAATGGILLGSEYHFDMTRPGIGIYGGAPFHAAKPTIQISLPVIQCRSIPAGASIGYGATYTASNPMRTATLLSGYADGIPRALSNKARFFAGDTPCPILGRISMDTITVDISALDTDPKTLDLIHPTQAIDDLAKMADTIGYELLTSLGSRYKRQII